MRLFATALIGSLWAASYAVALDQEIVSKMVDSARSIEHQASIVSLSLKTKKLDAEAVKQKIDTMAADVSKLQELVAAFESTHPQLSERDLADWKMLKDKVQLLEIFHGQKQKLASEDMHKNRAIIRAHADGVAKRAQKLQESARRLQRGPLS